MRLLPFLFLLLFSAAVQAACTTIAGCNYTINNGSCYQITAGTSCGPNDWGVRFNGSRADGAELNFSTNAWLLGIRSFTTCIDINGADNVKINGHGLSGLSWPNCASATTAILVRNGSQSAQIKGIQTSGTKNYNVYADNTSSVLIQNGSFGQSAYGIYFQNSNHTILDNNRQSTGAGSLVPMLHFEDSYGFCIIGYKVNNTDEAFAITEQVLVENSSSFEITMANISNRSSVAGSSPNSQTYIKVVLSTNFSVHGNYLDMGGVGVWLSDSNYSNRFGFAACPSTSAERTSKLNHFSTAGFIISSETGTGSFFNTQRLYEINDSAYGIEFYDNTHMVGSAPVIINNSFINTTITNTVLSSILINNAANNTMQDSSVSTGEYALQDDTIALPPITSPYLALVFLNTTINKSAFTNPMGSENGYCWDYWLHITPRLYGGANVSINVSFFNATPTLLASWLQKNNSDSYNESAALSWGGITRVRSGCGDFPSLPEFTHNETRPATINCTATGYRHGTNFTNITESNTHYCLLVQNKAPYIAPNFSVSNNSIEARNYSAQHVMAHVIDPEGDGIVPFPNCSLFSPSGGTAFSGNLTINASGVYNSSSNQTMNQLGYWQLVCRAADTYNGANATNSTWGRVVDTIPPKFAWLSVPPPGNYSNASSVLHLNGSGNDSFNVSAVNLSANWSGFAGFLIKKCSATTNYYYNLSCAFDWNLSTVPEGVYQICGSVNDTAPQNDTSCFQINVTAPPPVPDNPPTSNMTTPLNGTVFSLSTGNSTLNITIGGVPTDDHNFTNFSIRIWNETALVATLVNGSGLSNGTEVIFTILLPNGIYNFSSSVCDAAAAGPQCFNNETNWTFQINVTAPPLNCSFVPPTPANGSNVSGVTIVNVSCSSPLLSNISISINGSAVLNCTSSPCTYSWLTDLWPEGDYAVNFTANDTAGQSESDGIVLTIVEEEWLPFIFLIALVVGWFLYATEAEKKKGHMPSER